MNSNKKNELMSRFNDNLYDFHIHLGHLSRRKLIRMAGRIAAVNEAHEYLTKHYEWDEDEIEYFLMFADPLTIVADMWEPFRIDTSIIDLALWYAFDDDSLFTEYPLIGKA